MNARIIALLLAGLLGLCSPASAAAGRAPKSWEAIRRIEAGIEAANAPQSQEARAAAYAGAVEQMLRAVEAAPDYVPGSLDRHGDFFFWETADGRANGYSPSLRSELRTRGEAPLPAQTRGESPAPETEAPRTRTAEDNVGGSRDVGVFVPYSGSYYFYADKAIAEGQALADSTGGQLRVYTAENCTVDSLAQALEESGILLINSHGRTDYESGEDHRSRANTSYLCLPSFEGVTAADQRPVQGEYGTYRHAFYAGSSEDFDEEYYCVDGVCIANHMTGTAPHSMLWLGCCLGMATQGMETPLRAKGVEAMLGFTERVASNTDQGYRLHFVQALLRDCTVGEAAAYMKEKLGCPDPIDLGHEPAWPVFVSSQDPYPGRDHLTEAQEVHSTWKLHPAYPIQVTVEPAGTADVETLRSTLNVIPHRGWDFQDWALTQGEAQAERKGNQLILTAAGPCAVTLRMEARTPAAVEFSAGPGHSAAPIHEFIGDRVSLPAPEGTLEADAFLYHFLGWTREALTADSETPPALLKPGEQLELTQPETRLWAVYGCFVPEDGESLGQFRRVTEEPADWAGDYVLTYQSARVLRASPRFAGQAIISANAVSSLAAAGCFLDGDWLNEVPEELIYSFLADENGEGALKMKGSETYLAVPSSNVSLSTLSDPRAAGAAWRMRWSGEQVTVTNLRFPARTLQYSPTSSGFCTLTVPRGPLTLYRGVAGRRLYTTEPQRKDQQPQLPCGGGEDCPGRVFEDMPSKGHWAHDAIDWALSRGIAAGTGEARFSPGRTCTRAQIVTFLWRAAGSPEPEARDCPFEDVKPGAYYSKAVCWALERGITSGADAAFFRPGGGCTREQVVTFLWRAAGSPEPGEEDCPFPDVKPGSYARKAIAWAVERGITAGVSAGAFGPKRSCTRAQIVTFLYKAQAA